MLFNSYVFPAFFVLVYALYLGLRRRHRVQNALLLLASYAFYGYWDWRFLSLLAVSTLVDFHVGKALGRVQRDGPRKALLILSVVVNLSLLGTFKYFNFFADSFAQLLQAAGLHASYTTLHVILPVGISFYTFQTMSYTIDVYRRRLAPTSSMLDFALFVAFFPQLVAGPIERAANLLPQFARPRIITTAKVDAALFLLLWGYFKKVVIADNVARISDAVFMNHQEYQGLDLVLGALAFTVQIYCDFSGYSDIARGLARLLGFELMLNFRLPYFATSPSDFWQRWHISLSSWLRDYLYIPLGGNRRGHWATHRNLLLTMLLGGLWHGAAWNFVLWGLYHGVILVLYRLAGDGRSERACRGLRRMGAMAVMFTLTVGGWVIFRSQSATQVWYFATHLGWFPSAGSLEMARDLAFFAWPLLAVQVAQHWSRNLLIAQQLPAAARIVLYTLLLTGIVVFGVRESVEFIYYQF